MQVGRRARGEHARRLQRLLEAVAVDDVGARVAARDVVAHEPACGEPAADERLVDAGDRLQPEQLADREQVERDLQLLLVEPTSRRRTPSRPL